MEIENYAKVLQEAFLEKSEKDFDVFLSSFIATLKRQNKVKLLPKIYKKLEEIFRQEDKNNKTIVTFAKESDWEKFQDKVKGYSNIFNLDNIEIRQEENITGGFILRNRENLVDNSYKTKLLSLFKKVTK